jgi:tRNA pseudouridine38-40 synthase
VPPYRITLAYDGTDFEGWQAQATQPQPGRAKVSRTIQGTVEEALANLAHGARVRVTGAGRTDAGVHALGQVASFDLPRDMEPAALIRALNGLLPRDVRVLDSARVGADFDARRSASGKLYRYEMDLGPVALPTRQRFAGHLREPLDPDRVAAAAALYVGRHDFAALAAAGSQVKTTVRTVVRSDARLEGQAPAGGGPARLVYEVVADGFLRKMVRNMVGGIVAAGSGARDVADLARALEQRDRRRWPAPAEARGLTLVSVSYS